MAAVVVAADAGTNVNEVIQFDDRKAASANLPVVFSYQFSDTLPFTRRRVAAVLALR
jgi:hypothetical protein